jgi:hypothetical protein
LLLSDTNYHTDQGVAVSKCGRYLVYCKKGKVRGPSFLDLGFGDPLPEFHIVSLEPRNLGALVGTFEIPSSDFTFFPPIFFL